MFLSTKDVGVLGEKVAIKYLKSLGYKSVENNYAKMPFGEIDIIVKKDKRLFFVEVKSTASSDKKYLPQDHFNNIKLKKFQRISEIYIQEKKLDNIKYSFMLLNIFLDTKNKKAEVECVVDFS